MNVSLSFLAGGGMCLNFEDKVSMKAHYHSGKKTAEGAQAASYLPWPRARSALLQCNLRIIETWLSRLPCSTMHLVLPP